MLGAIIGDIVGSRFEFNNYLGTDFELFTKDSTYTDDTICTIAIADAILNNKSYKDSLIEWCQKYSNPMGSYGASFVRWIHSKDHQPYNSYGNGAAMRVSPIGWAFDEIVRTYIEAGFSAEVSHDHSEGIKGARCIADLIFQLRNKNINKTQVLEWVERSYHYNIPEFNSIKRGVFNETCQVTVPQAISCFLEARSFEEAIRLAVSIGGDSDTIAAITGSIAEAHYKIPIEIWENVFNYLPNDMQSVLGNFYSRYNINSMTLKL